MLMFRSTHESVVKSKNETLAGLTSELNEIDEIVLERPASIHLAGRLRKDVIRDVVALAVKADALEAENKRLEAELANRPQSEPDEIATLEKELEDVKAAIILTQETQPIVTSQRHQKRRDLVSLNNKRTELEGKLQAARSGKP